MRLAVSCCFESLRKTTLTGCRLYIGFLPHRHKNGNSKQLQKTKLCLQSKQMTPKAISSSRDAKNPFKICTTLEKKLGHCAIISKSL